MIKPVKIQAKAGSEAKAVLVFEIEKGFHIQANPAGSPQLIPTVVSVDSSPIVTSQGVQYPPGKPYRISGLEKPISTFEGIFEVELSLGLSQNSKQGKNELTGKIRYQACDSKICYFPKTLSFPITVEVR
jgi:hypothetical protein